MKWTDTENLAILLEKNHPDIEILSLRFTELRNLILKLPQFDDEENGCNEGILESIQMIWLEERECKS